MKYEIINRHKAVRSLALVIAIGIICAFVSQASAQRLSPRTRLGRFAPQSGSDAASAIFNGGRDLMSDGQWAKAEDAFKQYISTYPKEKNVDQALYWMAYSQFKLSKFDQCKSTIDRLLNDYQDTTWKTDAKTLLAQLPNQKTVNVDPVSVYVDPVEVERLAQDMAKQQIELAKEQIDAANEEINEQLNEKIKEKIQDRVKIGKGVGIGIGKGVATPDDDPCEFKIVVLQALFQSDVQRGIAVASDWLKAGSPQTVRCKSAALTLLARNGGKTVTPIILGVAQNESDLRLRTKAISVLGSTNDDSVIDPLRDFALNSQQSEITEAALYALSQHTGARAAGVLGEIAMSNKPNSLRRTAIAAIAGRQGEPALDALFKIYDSTQDIEIRKSVISGLARRRSERAGAKLLEIARSADNVELREAAISAIARRGGEQAVEILLNLYESEKDEGVRDQIINSLAYSNDQRVTRKLIEIAKNPQTPMERRRRAIMILSGRSKDPEVLKFLEDLLKQ